MEGSNGPPPFKELLGMTAIAGPEPEDDAEEPEAEADPEQELEAQLPPEADPAREQLEVAWGSKEAGAVPRAGTAGPPMAAEDPAADTTLRPWRLGESTVRAIR